MNTQIGQDQLNQFGYNAENNQNNNMRNPSVIVLQNKGSMVAGILALVGITTVIVLVVHALKNRK